MQEKTKRSSKFNILITGGINLGSFPSSKHMIMDSFENLKNTLKLARAKKIDFMIFTGNTFNRKYPSKVVLEETTEILKIGTGRVKEDNLKKVGHFDYLLPDRKSGFFQGDTKFRIPIFCVKGPEEVGFYGDIGNSGEDGVEVLSRCDFVHGTQGQSRDSWEAGGVNVVKPVVFVKNRTCLMIYFLDYCEDSLLLQKIKSGGVQFQRCKGQKSGNNFEKIFKFLVLRQDPLFDVKHQTAFEKDKVNPEIFPEGFFDLIIWGNKNFKTTELVEKSGQKIFKISDLSRNENLSLYDQKYRHVGLLTVQKGRMKTRSCLMDCVRPVIRRKVVIKSDVKGSLMKIEKDLMIKISSHYRAGTSPERGSEDILIEKPILALKILSYCEKTEIDLWAKKFEGKIKDLIANHR